MKLRGNKIPRFFVKYSHWERRKLRCFFFSALGFGISSFLSWKKANRRIASTASEYPLADFALFRSPARTVKIACWGAGLRWRPRSVKRFEAPTEPTGETSQTLMRNGGGAYKADMREIQERLDEIWQLQRRILSSGR